MRKLKVRQEEESSSELDPAQKKALSQLSLFFGVVLVAVIGVFYYIFVLRPPH